MNGPPAMAQEPTAITTRGVGTASRVLPDGHTVGVVTLTNFGYSISQGAQFNSNLTFTGGFTGTGNVALQLNEAAGNAGDSITLSGTSINNTGTITNNGVGVNLQGVTISSIIGTFVTGVVQNSQYTVLNLNGANGIYAGSMPASGGGRSQYRTARSRLLPAPRGVG